MADQVVGLYQINAMLSVSEILICVHSSDG